jgi:outer membrane immunogenic protein
MIRRVLLAFAITLGLVGNALSADLPIQPPPVYLPPPPLWTGPYAGVNVGYTFGASNVFGTGAVPVQFCPVNCSGLVPLFFANAAAASAAARLHVTDNGVIGGGQFGYNYQLPDKRWLIGIEADLQGTSAAGGATGVNVVGGVPNSPLDRFTTNLAVHKSLTTIGTLRERAGFLLTPTLLIYGTGGLAYGRVSTSADYFTNLSPGADIFFFHNYNTQASASGWRAGWTAGAGGEWLFAPQWSVKTEYLYYDLGTVTGSALLIDRNFNRPDQPILFTNKVTSSHHFNGSIVRVGLNYHF